MYPVIEENTAPVRASAVRSCRVQSQISTWKPSSWMRRALFWIGRSRYSISAHAASVYIVSRSPELERSR